jgi:hypothetical protein
MASGETDGLPEAVWGRYLTGSIRRFLAFIVLSINRPHAFVEPVSIGYSIIITDSGEVDV